MYRKPTFGLFISGTDTEVGKTYVAAAIARQLVSQGYRVGVYKPIASDCVSDGKELVSEDAFALWEAAGRPLHLSAVCPQRFPHALAPHLAARQNGEEVSAELLRSGLSVWADECDVVIVEGAGGLMSPTTDDEFIADLAYDLGYPVVMVAPNVVGVINQSLSALITAANFRDGLNVAGIVLNDTRRFDRDVSRDSNREQIAARSVAPVISRLRYKANEFDEPIDWMEIARMPKAVIESGSGKAKAIC